MTIATVRLVNEQCMSKFYVRGNQAATARSLLKDGWYRVQTELALEQSGESAAEEVFDLTNNPSRQSEREQVYGRGRSLSVGDIVTVNGVHYLCASQGWLVLSV